MSALAYTAPYRRYIFKKAMQTYELDEEGEGRRVLQVHLEDADVCGRVHACDAP